MNIFFVDKDPSIAAHMLCDKHVIKMIVESAQILSGVQRLCGNNSPSLYKTPTGNKVPINWVMQGQDNYLWLFKHYCALLKEYTKRYGKSHKSGNAELFAELEKIPSRLLEGSTIPLCSTKDVHFLEKINTWDDVITEYCYFYYRDKNRFALWNKGSEKPDWYKDLERKYRRNTNV